MKNIILPAKELRLLTNQLENFNVGYTVPQIRSLNKVLIVMEENLKPFNEGLKKIQSVIVSQVNEKEKAEGEAKKQKEFEEFIRTEGEKKVTCALEDVDFEFVKLIWSKMSTFSGVKEAREAVLKIDDAILNASEPVFTNGESKLNPMDKPKTN